MITHDLSYLVVEAAARLGRDGKGTGGLHGYLEHLGETRKASPAKLQQLRAAAFVAITIEKEADDG